MFSPFPLPVKCYADGVDRRISIADAAIALIARDGLRGLTHRAVDRHLRLPDGSASYYFSTREALIAAATERLVDLDSTDVARTAPDPESISRLVGTWLGSRRRERLRARFELFLAAGRSPAARPILDARRRLLAQVTEVMRQAGASEPRRAALAVMVAVDGLLLAGMLGGRVSVRDRTAVLAPIIEEIRRGGHR